MVAAVGVAPSAPEPTLREDAMRSIGLVFLLVCATLVFSGQAVALPSSPCHVPDQGAPVGAFAVPDGGELTVLPMGAGRLQCTLSRADGTVFAQAETDGEGLPEHVVFYNELGMPRLEVNMEREPGPLEPAPGEGSSEEEPPPPDDARVTLRCSTTNYKIANVTWAFSPINWYLNRDSIPTYMDKDNTVTAVRNAHIEWENNQTSCDVADNSALNFTYSGDTNRTRDANDGASVVDWGEVQPNCLSTDIACEVKQFSNLTGEVVASDIRFDPDVLWTNLPLTYPNRFDVWNVAAHEVGHRSLFGHVDDSHQVMYKPSFKGSTYKRSLGRGDAVANNKKW